MKYSIYLKQKDNYFKLFKLGYSSDGGFFIQDLVNDGKSYLAFKLLVPPQKKRAFGLHKIPMNKGEYWVTSKSPKFSHHADGRAQISGKGVTSGLYKFFSGSKGLSSQSMNLSKRDNDGGPIFSFHIKNLSRSRYVKKNSNIIIDEYLQINDHPNFPSKNELGCSYSLEFFYLNRKEAATCLNLSNSTVKFNHPNYGVIPLRYIPAPEYSPGVIGVMTTVQSKGDDEGQFSFSMSGGAGADLPRGEFEHLFIIYPYIPEMTDDIKTKKLDFKGMNKFKSSLDHYFFTIKTWMINQVSKK